MTAYFPTNASPRRVPLPSSRSVTNANLAKAVTPGAEARNEILRTSSRLRRKIWRRWSGHYRRSLVETKMYCCKLLGERVRSRDYNREVAELQIRAAILNRFNALGTPQTQRVA